MEGTPRHSMEPGRLDDERRAEEAPRIVEERPIVGPEGEEGREVVDEHGRRFWQFRPVYRERYDLLGFGWFWWLIVWIVIVGLIVWGWGWGWS